jgi:hypothetical protein
LFLSHERLKISLKEGGQTTLSCSLSIGAIACNIQTAMNTEMTKLDMALAIIGILAFVCAILVCTEPAIPYFWTKLASFAGVGVLCVVFSSNKLAVILATVLFIVLRLIFWFFLSLLRAR